MERSDSKTPLLDRNESPPATEASPAKEALKNNLDSARTLKTKPSWFGSLRDAALKGALTMKAGVDFFRPAHAEGDHDLSPLAKSERVRLSEDDRAPESPPGVKDERKNTFSPKRAYASVRQHFPSRSKHKRGSIHNIVSGPSNTATDPIGPEQFTNDITTDRRSDEHDEQKHEATHSRRASLAESLANTMRGVGRSTSQKRAVRITTPEPTAKLPCQIHLPSSPIDIVPTAPPALHLDFGPAAFDSTTFNMTKEETLPVETGLFHAPDVEIRMPSGSVPPAPAADSPPAPATDLRPEPATALRPTPATALPLPSASTSSLCSVQVDLKSWYEMRARLPPAPATITPPPATESPSTSVQVDVPSWHEARRALAPPSTRAAEDSHPVPAPSPIPGTTPMPGTNVPLELDGQDEERPPIFESIVSSIKAATKDLRDQLERQYPSRTVPQQRVYRKPQRVVRKLDSLEGPSSTSPTSPAGPSGTAQGQQSMRRVPSIKFPDFNPELAKHPLFDRKHPIWDSKQFLFRKPAIKSDTPPQRRSSQGRDQELSKHPRLEEPAVRSDIPPQRHYGPRLMREARDMFGRKLHDQDIEEDAHKLEKLVENYARRDMESCMAHLTILEAEASCNVPRPDDLGPLVERLRELCDVIDKKLEEDLAARPVPNVTPATARAIREIVKSEPRRSREDETQALERFLINQVFRDRSMKYLPDYRPRNVELVKRLQQVCEEVAEATYSGTFEAWLKEAPANPMEEILLAAKLDCLRNNVDYDTSGYLLHLFDRAEKIRAGQPNSNGVGTIALKTFVSVYAQYRPERLAADLIHLKARSSTSVAETALVKKLAHLISRIISNKHTQHPVRRIASECSTVSSCPSDMPEISRQPHAGQVTSPSPNKRIDLPLRTKPAQKESVYTWTRRNGLALPEMGPLYGGTGKQVDREPDCEDGTGIIPPQSTPTSHTRRNSATRPASADDAQSIVTDYDEFKTQHLFGDEGTGTGIELPYYDNADSSPSSLVVPHSVASSPVTPLFPRLFQSVSPARQGSLSTPGSVKRASDIGDSFWRFSPNGWGQEDAGAGPSTPRTTNANEMANTERASYKCPYADCQRAFSHRSSLTRHQNLYHGTIEILEGLTAASPQSYHSVSPGRGNLMGDRLSFDLTRSDRNMRYNALQGNIHVSEASDEAERRPSANYRFQTPSDSEQSLQLPNFEGASGGSPEIGNPDATRDDQASQENGSPSKSAGNSE